MPCIRLTRLKSSKKERILSQNDGPLWFKIKCWWNSKTHGELGRNEEGWTQNKI